MIREVVILFQIALFLISHRVYTGVIDGKNMWRWISLYWIVLSAKNFGDLIASCGG